MSLSWSLIGDRIRKARIDSGLTQDQVATALGLSRPSISLIEAGRRPINSIELAKLARLLHVPLHWLLAPPSGEVERDFDGVEQIFVRAQEVSAPARGLLAEFLLKCRQHAELEQRVKGSVSRVSVRYLPGDLGRGPVHQGEEMARLERRRLGLGSGPTSVRKVLEDSGVKLFIAHRPDVEELAGASVGSDEFGSAMLVNVAYGKPDDVVPGRLNFTAAHEYAHLLIDSDRAPVDMSDYARDRRPFEQRANAFAAAFLMPREGMVSELERLSWGGQIDPSYVLHLSVVFGASYDATLWRLQNLGLISPTQRESLDEKFRGRQRWIKLLGYEDVYDEQQRAWYVPEREIRFPSDYRFLVLKAYRDGQISAGRAASLLSMDRQDFEDAFSGG